MAIIHIVMRRLL